MALASWLWDQRKFLPWIALGSNRYFNRWDPRQHCIINSKFHTFLQTTYTAIQNILLIIGMKCKLSTKWQFSKSNCRRVHSDVVQDWVLKWLRMAWFDSGMKILMSSGNPHPMMTISLNQIFKQSWVAQSSGYNFRHVTRVKISSVVDLRHDHELCWS
jgi:hypothetical protein